MAKYYVVREVLVEEIVEVEADTEIAAMDAVQDGAGQVVDQNVFWPQVIGIQELEDV